MLLTTLHHIANLLRGKKTYLVSAAALVYGAGIVRGFWPHQPGIDFLLTGGGLASLRAAVGKVEDSSGSFSQAARNRELYL